MSRGLGAVQRFVLLFLLDQPRPRAVGGIANAWAARDGGLRPATASEYESVRRACRSLAAKKLIEQMMVYSDPNYLGYVASYLGDLASMVEERRRLDDLIASQIAQLMPDDDDDDDV